MVTAPTNTTVFHAPASFAFTATATDSGGSVTQVEFFQGTSSLGVDDVSPYSVQVSDLAAGNYSLSAVATDNNGARATNSVNIVVNALPSVALNWPTNNTVFAAPLTNTLQAAASDPDGSIQRVQFFNGADLLGSDTAEPYEFTVTNLAAGSYTLSARAIDNRGGSNSSSGVVISVVTPVPVVLAMPHWISASEFRFIYSANVGLRYVVERGTHLPDWSPVHTNTAGTNPVTFTDENALGAHHAYRVLRLPNP
jgi:hypothetical protein